MERHDGLHIICFGVVGMTRQLIAKNLAIRFGSANMRDRCD
jgi:hypothetical protein